MKQTISKTTQREKEREHSKKLNARGRELERAAENELSCWRKREREIEDVMRERERARMRGFFFT